MRATILDTQTGLRKTVDGRTAFQWAEGNFSCDCNRNVWEPDKPPPFRCQGQKRYLVVAATMDWPEDKIPYTLEELNAGYPKELLEQHGIPTAPKA